MNQPSAPAENEAQSSLDVFEVIGTARATRWFRADPVPESLIERVLWAATRAPSPDNTQPWSFLVVQDPDVRNKIGQLFADLMKSQAAQSSSSVASDTATATERRTREGAINLASTIGDVPVIVFVCGANAYPPSRPDVTVMYSALHAAAQNMILAARALGLGAAFTTLHRLVEPSLRDLLAIPDEQTMAVMVPIGWPARGFGPLTRRPLEEVVHHDRW